MPPWLIYHEVSERAIVCDHHIYSRFRRWFCDGAAEVIAELCTREIFGGEAYEKALTTWGDASAYGSDIAKVDLLNWRAAECEDDLPVQMDNHVRRAHYFYATQEVRGLVGRHGRKVLPQIIREIDRLDSTDSESILKAIRYVTGEDMRSHLAVYGSAINDPYKGLAVCYPAVGYAQLSANGYRVGDIVKTNNIPLLFDGKHAIVLQFDFGVIDPPVTVSAELVRAGTKISDQTVDIDRKAGRVTMEFQMTTILKPGDYTLKLSLAGKCFKSIPIKLYDPEAVKENA